MAKLTGAKRKAFLERMEKGRKKAARAKKKASKPNPVKKKAKATGAKKPSKSRPISKRTAATQRKVSKPLAKKKRGNPDDVAAAERKFQEFHGKPAGRVIEYEQVYRYPDAYAEMGKLIELRFDLDEDNPGFPLTRFKGCQAVCTPDGANIYFIGGDQTIDFEALNISSDKDFVQLGPCTYICYHTVKGFHDFDPTDYYHPFGEEDGVLPVLAYDRLNKALFLIGGNYRVRPEGIVN